MENTSLIHKKLLLITILGLLIFSTALTTTQSKNALITINDNDTNTITFEKDTLTSFKENPDNANDSALLYNYTLQVQTDTPIQFLWRFSASFYHYDKDTNSIGTYFGTINHKQYFTVNQTQTLSLTSDFPSLATGPIAILISRTTTDLTNQLSSTYSNYFYFNLTKNSFLSSLTISPYLRFMDFNNDNNTDAIKLQIYTQGINYTYDPETILSDGTQILPSITIDYRFSEFNQSTGQVGNTLVFRTTYKYLEGYQQKPFEYYFFPPKLQFYYCSIKVKLFDMVIKQWNTTFYSDHSTWFYDQPHELNVTPIDISGDNSMDSVSFSLTANPDHPVRALLDYDMEISVEYFNVTTNNYQRLYYPFTYVLSPKETRPWNQMTYLFTAPFEARYRFNISLIYNELYYCFEFHSYEYDLHTSFPTYDQLMFRVYAEYNSSNPKNFIINDSLEGQVSDGSPEPYNFTIEYDVYYQNPLTDELELEVSFVNSYYEKNDFIGISDFQGYIADEYGDYYVNVTLYVNSTLYFWSYIYVPVTPSDEPLQIVNRIYEEGIKDVDEDGLSDSVYFVIYSELLNTSVPTTLTLVASLYKQVNDNEYLFVQDYFKNVTFESTSIQFEVQYEIGSPGNYLIRLFWISEDGRFSHITDFEFSLEDEEISRTTSTTSTHTNSTSSNTTNQTSTESTNSTQQTQTTIESPLTWNNSSLTLLTIIVISFLPKQLKKRKNKNE